MSLSPSQQPPTSRLVAAPFSRETMPRDLAFMALLVLAIVGFPAPVEAQSPTAPSLPAPRFSGYVQVRETVAPGTGLSAALNRVRLIVDGALPSRFAYRVAVEYAVAGTGTAAAAVSLRDAYVRWSLAPWSLTAGQFKTPFSREYVT